MVVGHSLGGGAATLMSIFLQSTYPNTCCAFDPPGETLSPGLRERSTHFITTTVFGNDIFPRFSSYTYSLLQDNIIASLCYCKISKFQFFVSLLANKLTIDRLFYLALDELEEEKENVLTHWMKSVRERLRAEG